MSELAQVLRNPLRFMEVGIPLPQQVGKSPSPRRNKRWPWTLLAVVVVSFGIVYLLYLDGRINNTTPPEEGGDDNNGTTTSTSAPTFVETEPPTMTPNIFSTDEDTSAAPSPQTQAPVPPALAEPLVYTGWCSPDTPCFECEGQCFVDDDCFGTLVCFPRIGNTKVPGCLGSGIFGVSYCHDPTTAVIPLLVYERECSSDEPCGLCQGMWLRV